MLTPDQLLDFMELVENDGGVHLTGLCTGHSYKQAKHPGEKKVQRFTTRCNKPSRFIVTYTGEKEQEGTFVACANDDLMDRWPRYTRKEVGHAGTSRS